MGSLTLEQQVLSDLSKGPLALAALATAAQVNAAANLTRKGLAWWDAVVRAYRITSKGSSFLSRI